MTQFKRGQLGIIAVIAIVIVAALVGYFYFNPTEVDVNPFNEEEEGEVIFAVTDAAADMENVQEVRVNVDRVEAHYTSETEAETEADAETENEEWVTLSTSSRTYNLLELDAENRNELLLSENVTARNYDMVRLYVQNVIVVDNEGEHEAKVPSERLQIRTDVNVDANSTATVLFDFQADESLHVTGEGTYILAPVIHVESRSNAQAEVRSDNSVEISGGNVETRATVGTDLQGNVGVGVRVPADANISLGSGGTISIGSGSSDSGAEASSDTSASASTSNGNVSADSETDVGIY